MVSRFHNGYHRVDPRDTSAWRTLRNQVYREETHCWVCGMWVEQSLPKTHPMSRTVDHLIPVARGGAGIPDRSGVRLAHRRCNGKRGHRPTTTAQRTLTIDPTTI